MDLTTYEIWHDDQDVHLMHTTCRAAFAGTGINTLSEAMQAATQHNAKCSAIRRPE